MNIVNPIQKHRQMVAQKIAQTFSREEEPEILDNLEKGLQVFTQEGIDKFQLDLRKSLGDNSISQDEFEKGMKDIAKLEKKTITDKNGHTRIVYVRHMNDQKHEFEEGHKVAFEHKGKPMVGHIKKLKHHEVYDKFGTAEIHGEDGQKYSKSLRAIEHHKDHESRKADDELDVKPKDSKKPSKKINNNISVRSSAGVAGQTSSGKRFHSEIVEKQSHFSPKDHEEMGKEYERHAKESKVPENREKYAKLAEYHNTAAKGKAVDHPYKGHKSALQSMSENAKENTKRIEQKSSERKQEEDGGVKRLERNEEPRKTQKELVKELTALKAELKEKSPSMSDKLWHESPHHGYDASALEVKVKQYKQALAKL